MKTLVKISFVIVCALFVSMSVKAADPAKTGTITTQVVKYLAFDNFTSDVALTYDEFGSADVMSAETLVKVKTNVDYKLSLVATSDKFTTSTGKDFALAKVTVKGLGADIALSQSAITANKLIGDKETTVTFELADLGNQYAGSYTANIQYTLSE